MTDHIQGPWHISTNGSDVENIESAGVCAMYADETSEAKARLIAASPDLLDALDWIIKTADSAHETGITEGACIAGNWDVLGPKIRSAFAKATDT